MYIKITVNVGEPWRGEAEATLILKGERIQSVRIGQWIEQTMSRLCKEVTQCPGPEKKDACCGRNANKET